MKDSISGLIRFIDNLFQSEINKDLKDSCITNSQAEVLIRTKLKNDEKIEINQIDLQNELNLSNPTITGILNRLEEKGLIKRMASIKNARYKSIVITDSGREELKKGELVIRKIEAKLVNGLTDKEIETLSNLLEKILNNMR